MRKPIIAGNWKMHKTIGEAIETCRNLAELIEEQNVEVVVCPPFTALSAVNALGLANIGLAAQNMADAESGAYTGEVSVLMLRDIGCKYVILGHSERRELFNETDEQINKKARLALKYRINPIICVGETLAQRKANETETVVVSQVKAAFDGITATDAVNVVIAYEPIWAIGTGETASAADANQVIATIRKTIAEIYDQEVANAVRIQYGGSVKSSNIKELMAEPEIDGALVGGASLDAKEFAAIVNYNVAK